MGRTEDRLGLWLPGILIHEAVKLVELAIACLIQGQMTHGETAFVASCYAARARARASQHTLLIYVAKTGWHSQLALGLGLK